MSVQMSWNELDKRIEKAHQQGKIEAYDEIFELILNQENQIVNFSDKICMLILRKKKEMEEQEND